MKLTLILLALGVAPSAASELLSSFGAPRDANSAFAQLTGVMSAAKRELGLAERRHGKVVKKVRKEAAAALGEEAKAYGSYISGYSAELARAEAGFLGVLRGARSGLAAAEAAPVNPNDWKDPNAEKKARLGSLLAAADRDAKRAERRGRRRAEEAVESGEEVLEDEASKLGMKVGDMTPLVDQAKKTLEAAAAQETPGNATAQDNATVTLASKDVNVTVLGDDVAKAMARNQAAVKESNQKLDGFLSKTAKEVAARIAKLQQGLEVAQRDEVAKIKVGVPGVAMKGAKKSSVGSSATASKAAKVTPAAKLAAKVTSAAKLKATPAATGAKAATAAKPGAVKATSAATKGANTLKKANAVAAKAH